MWGLIHHLTTRKRRRGIYSHVQSDSGAHLRPPPTTPGNTRRGDFSPLPHWNFFFQDLPGAAAGPEEEDTFFPVPPLPLPGWCGTSPELFCSSSQVPGSLLLSSLSFLGLTLFPVSLCQACWCVDAACSTTTGGFLLSSREQAGKSTSFLRGKGTGAGWQREAALRLPCVFLPGGCERICVDLFHTVSLCTPC